MPRSRARKPVSGWPASLMARATASRCGRGSMRADRLMDAPTSGARAKRCAAAAPPREDKAGDAMEERGLTRAVRPDEPRNGACLHVEIHAFERVNAVEAASQRAHL